MVDIEKFVPFNGSIGKFLYEKLIQLPQDDIIQVNGLTGVEETVAEVLQSGLEIAKVLRYQGVSAGDVVAICGGYSSEFLAVVLGALLHNTKLLVINETYKQLEISHLLGLAPPKIAFSDPQPAKYIKSALDKINHPADIIIFDKQTDNYENVQSSNNTRCKRYTDIIGIKNDEDYEVESVTDPENTTALIMHSSGTTGLPKAVQLTHANLTYSCQISQSFPYAKTKSPTMHAIAASWLSGFIQIVHSLTSGFKRVYVNPSGPENTILAIANQKPEWMLTSPIFLYRMTQLPDLHKHGLTSLKRVMLGGAPPMANLKTAAQNAFPWLELEQCYGCTEVCGFITEPFVNPPWQYAGKLIRGMITKIVDVNSGRPLNRNEQGELRFKPSHASLKGYMNNTEATAKGFDKDGYFSTEDIGTVDDEGYITILGRTKEFIQSKIRDVPPSTIEYAIGEMDGVEDVAVVGLEQPHLGYSLIVACVVKSPQATITEQQIIDHVKQNMGDMNNLDGGVRFYTSIPRNSNGKVLRHELEMQLKENKSGS